MLTTPINFVPEYQDNPQSSPNKMDQNDFLRLLVVQMQNQDPIEPLRNEEFVAQLAQFSSLEQLMNMNETLTALNMLQSSINNSQAVNLIGKRITVEGNALQISNGEASRMVFQLGNASESVTAKIVNSEGQAVRTIQLGAREVGRHEISFDGKNDAGEDLPDGNYTFQVTAVGSDDEVVAISNYTEVKVEGITFDEGIVYLVAGGQRYMLSDIIEVMGD